MSAFFSYSRYLVASSFSTLKYFEQRAYCVFPSKRGTSGRNRNYQRRRCRFSAIMICHLDNARLCVVLRAVITRQSIIDQRRARIELITSPARTLWTLLPFAVDFNDTREETEKKMFPRQALRNIKDIQKPKARRAALVKGIRGLGDI